MGMDQMPGLPHWDPQASGNFHKNFKICSFPPQNLFTLAFRGHCLPLKAQAPASAFPGSSSQGCPGLGRPTKQGSDRVPRTAGLFSLTSVDKHLLGVRGRSWISGVAVQASGQGHPAVWAAAFLGGLSFPAGPVGAVPASETTRVRPLPRLVVEPFVALCGGSVRMRPGASLPLPGAPGYRPRLRPARMLLYGWADHSSQVSLRGTAPPPGWGTVLGVPPQASRC